MSNEDGPIPNAIVEEPQVSRVGVRVPPFWPADPTVWFAQLESQFILSRVVTDETKFHYVVSQLDTQCAMEVKDVIKNPPASGKYEKIKTELIKRLCASQEKRLKQLLEREELGDRKPSQFLRHLEGLAGADVPSQFMKTIWTSRLFCRTVLASRRDEPLEYLADLADSVYDIAAPSPQVASTSSSGADRFDEMTKQISELTRQVASLTSHMSRKGHPGRSRSKSQRSDRSRSRSRPQQPPPNHPHCFYHFTYGAKAKKCKQPCTFTSGNAQGGRK
ncbi:unnamed protein product [Arctia plantaginis]|uniref:DUF7041 domain-containing protein n=1 Tax=Arctia plantaginis TaxID=874455 RepID=A0A8S0YNI6_ARCPL|nr:unnamed protein product [Arctia plantaginis]